MYHNTTQEANMMFYHINKNMFHFALGNISESKHPISALNS